MSHNDSSDASKNDDDETVVVKRDRHDYDENDPTIRVHHDVQGSPQTEPDELAIGTVLKDRFVIEGVLGHGGMGVVYRALDLRKQETHDRDPYVALKALSKTFQQDERMVLALQRESRKAQSLAHPNIATVYDFDRAEDLVYLTMEQLSGSPMDEFILDHPNGLPVARVAPMLRGICLGLAYAHNKNIVHSDFKPGNVFVDENDNPKVLDFGIARATPTDTLTGASDVTVFDAGELGALTPSYASKEMFFGEVPHPADDVYALAITAYQLLTGRHPFNNKPAPTAQAEDLRPANIPGIKRRHWRAIRHGLAFERADRQQHAAEFLREFEGASKLRLISSVAIVLGIGFLSYVGFVQVQEQARVAPDVDFESLPGDVQSIVQERLREGRLFAEFGQPHSALSLFRDAYGLHPRNPEATEDIITLMSAFSDQAIENNDAEAIERATQHLDDLMDTDGFLGTHEELVAIRDRLVQAPGARE